MDINKDLRTRYYTALDALKEYGYINSIAAFCSRYGYDRHNMTTLRYSDTRKVNAEYLSHLAEDYPISAHWLLTGKGEMWALKPENVAQPVRTITGG